jgi:uncharacterized protein YlxP (DUF503 family)
MVVGISVFELHLPGARNLKDKRRVIKSLIDRLERRHRLSIYESGYHDLHQRSEIATALVGPSEASVRGVLERVRDLVDSESECMLTRWEPQYLEELS